MKKPNSKHQINQGRRAFLTQVAGGAGASVLFGGPLGAGFQSAARPSRNRVAEIADIRWEMGPPMPFPSKGQAQAVIGENLIGAGGAQLMQELPPDFNHRVDPEVTKQHIFEGVYMPWGRAAWLYDTRTMKSEILPQSPVGFHWPMGAAVGEDFYVVGGYIRPADDNDRQELKRRVGAKGKNVWQASFHADGDYTSRRVFRLSRSSGTWRWEEMPSLRMGRFIPGVAVSGTKIVVVGGQSSYGAAPFTFDFWGVDINAAETFDTAAPQQGWVELPPIPWMGRESMAAAAIGDNVYIFGGVYGNYSHVKKGEQLTKFADFYPLRKYCGDAYVLNLESRRWRKLPDLPFPIQGWEAVVYKNRYIILVGGIKDPNIEHPYAHQDRLPKASLPNFEVVIFDAEKETYRILPTPIPPYKIHPGQFAANPSEAEMHDVREGGYRLASKLGLIGNKLYLCGGEVISPHNVTDEVVVGTIVEA